MPENLHESILLELRSGPFFHLGDLGNLKGTLKGLVAEHEPAREKMSAARTRAHFPI